jgi:branched-subunit amino acid aminotransferase/4-amino-4-deoxychorismate lyase
MTEPSTVALHLALNGESALSTDAEICSLLGRLHTLPGLFETLRVLRGRPVFLAEHYARLRRSAAALKLSLVSSESEMRQRCVDIAAANRLQDGALKMVLFRDDRRESELVLIRSGLYPPSEYDRGFHLQVVPDQRPISGPALKKTDDLKNGPARAEARKAGFDDALFAEEENRIYETSIANIFIVSGGKIFTPPTDRSILPGVAREQVLRRESARVFQREISRADLRKADEVFLTNALLGVMPVSRIGETTYPKSSYVTVPELMKRFRAWQEESIAGTD